MPTLNEFGSRFLDGYARANRQKPSGIAAKETILNVHLLRLLGSKRLDAIGNEDVPTPEAQPSAAIPEDGQQRAHGVERVVEESRGVERVGSDAVHDPAAADCQTAAGLYDFDDYERLIEAARVEPNALLIVLLGGEAGLRCGEMMALEWRDVDLTKRQICVQRSDWKGHVTVPKGGRLRYVPMTVRLAAALRDHRHLRGPRVLCQPDGSPLSADVVKHHVERAARRARLDTNGVHRLRHTFCSHLAMRGAPARAIQELAGHQDLTTTQRYMHLSPAALEGAIRLLDGPGIPIRPWQHGGNGIPGSGEL